MNSKASAAGSLAQANPITSKMNLYPTSDPTDRLLVIIIFII
jgi:hypothetical protein